MIKDFVKLEDIEEAEKGTDKGEKIKQLTAEFFKTHEQLNKLGTDKRVRKRVMIISFLFSFLCYKSKPGRCRPDRVLGYNQCLVIFPNWDNCNRPI